MPKQMKHARTAKRTRSESPVEKLATKGQKSTSAQVKANSSGSVMTWRTLEHNGPYFAPPYERWPKNVKLEYSSSKIVLSSNAEEAAGFYAKELARERAMSPGFKENFFNDWRKQMTEKEKGRIKSLSRCNFAGIVRHFKQLKKPELSTTEKTQKKQEAERIQKEYGYCTWNGREEKITNFKLPPPGIFWGRGDHPKSGCLKDRINPEDIVINCSPSSIPDAPEGHNWKEVRHDNTVSWLVHWKDNVLGQLKYIGLNPESTLSVQREKKKFETARQLGYYIDKVRAIYDKDMRSQVLKEQQRGLALYLIDNFALRVGNEKGRDTADTVGCCSLRKQHIKLTKTKNGTTEVTFDFLGKDSIRFNKTAPVPPNVFIIIKKLQSQASAEDSIFSELTPSNLNSYLKTIVPGLKLTAKVFRTYHASRKLEEELAKTPKNCSSKTKIEHYKAANTEVALLCNHQKANKNKDNNSVSLLTSKKNYIDPRITVAWCQNHGIAISKVFSKSLRDKFAWAIEENDDRFIFDEDESDEEEPGSVDEDESDEEDSGESVNEDESNEEDSGESVDEDESEEEESGESVDEDDSGEDYEEEEYELQ